MAGAHNPPKIKDLFGFTPTQQKDLFIDFERKNQPRHLTKFSTHIAGQREYYYGAANDPNPAVQTKRRQYQKLANYIKSLPIDKYVGKLRELGVNLSEATKQELEANEELVEEQSPPPSSASKKTTPRINQTATSTNGTCVS